MEANPWPPSRIKALQEHVGISMRKMDAAIGLPHGKIAKFAGFHRPSPETCRKIDKYALSVGFIE